MKHLIFYDGHCSLCRRAVINLLKADKKKKLLFAPLQGSTAKTLFKKVPELTSLILMENFGSSKQQELHYGKAALRICWHLGGLWSLLGLLSFLPTFLVDILYRFIARRRHFFGGRRGEIVLPHDRRLLP